MAHLLKVQEEEVFRQHFKLLDLNGDGVLSKRELYSGMLECYGREVTKGAVPCRAATPPAPYRALL